MMEKRLEEEGRACEKPWKTEPLEVPRFVLHPTEIEGRPELGGAGKKGAKDPFPNRAHHSF
jgi:hypothetical protein